MYSKEELKNLKTDFWESYARFCDVQPQLLGRKPMWMLYDTKVKGVELKFDVSRQGISVALEINHRSEADRLAMFERIGWHKETLESGFDANSLVWEMVFELENRKQVARIYIQMSELDFHRRNQWGEIFHFFAANMFLLERNFLEIRDFLLD